MAEFERCLRYGRKDKQMSQRQLAEYAGMEVNDIIKLESGIFVHLENDTLRKLASTLNIEPEMFISMYRSDYYQDLKRTSGEKQTPHSSEFADLEKAILALPSDKKESLLYAIEMLLRLASSAA